MAYEAEKMQRVVKRGNEEVASTQFGPLDLSFGSYPTLPYNLWKKDPVSPINSSLLVPVSFFFYVNFTLYTYTNPQTCGEKKYFKFIYNDKFYWHAPFSFPHYIGLNRSKICWKFLVWIHKCSFWDSQIIKKRSFVSKCWACWHNEYMLLAFSTY